MTPRLLLAGVLAGLFVGAFSTGAGGAGAPTAGSRLSALHALEDAWHPGKRISVSTVRALRAQAASPRGAEVVVQPGIYTGEIDFSAKPSSPVRYVFLPGVKFTGGAGTCGCRVYSAIRVSGSNLILWGPADVTNPYWNGMRIENASNIVVGGGLKVHDAGLQGILVQANDGPGPSNIWLDGVESTNNGTQQGADNAGDSWATYWKAGTHALFWGTGTVGGGVINSYFHDQNSGYCIQIYGAAGDSIFAFNTLTRCLSPGDGTHNPGAGIEAWEGGSGYAIVANVIDGATMAGVDWCRTGGTVAGNVFRQTPVATKDDGCGTPALTVTDSHQLHRQLGPSDRPQANSPLANLASRYLDYMPRRDFAGNLRTTADPGAFSVPSRVQSSPKKRGSRTSSG
jgi:hypothetical protein